MDGSHTKGSIEPHGFWHGISFLVSWDEGVSAFQ